MKLGVDIDLAGFVRRQPEDDEVIRVFNDQPQLTSDKTLFPIACLRESSAVAEYLIANGNISAVNEENADGTYNLERVIARGGDLRFIEAVLAAGANPNLGRTIFTTYNRRSTDKVLVLGLLLKYGVDVNKIFAMYGDKKNVRSALDFCSGDPEFAGALRKAGAKTARVILKENPNVPIDGVEEK